MTTLTALAYLTGATVRRLFRQGVVMRSLAFPIVLTAGTLLATLSVFSFSQPEKTIGIPVALIDSPLADELAASGLRPVPTTDPEAAIRDGEVGAATDGKTLWFYGEDRVGLLAERAVRTIAQAKWRPAPGPLPNATATETLGTIVTRLLCSIYTLYGVVFGAAMVARDRDDGTLEVELSLPVALWVHGAARFLASVAVLSLFVTLAVLFYDALAGMEDPIAMICNGIAASVTATSLGLIAIGRGGLEAGFAGSLAFGLSILAGLAFIGVVVPSSAQYLPVASLVTPGGTLVPMVVSVVLGIVAILAFSIRSARA